MLIQVTQGYLIVTGQGRTPPSFPRTQFIKLQYLNARFHAFRLDHYVQMCMGLPSLTNYMPNPSFCCHSKAKSRNRTCLCEASRTLRSLPLSGKTPYLSLPMIPRPATAKAFAESPSVKIKVQSPEFFVPASLASSNLGMP